MLDSAYIIIYTYILGLLSSKKDLFNPPLPEKRFKEPVTFNICGRLVLHRSGFICRISGFICQISGFIFRISGFICRISGFICWISGFICRISGFICRISGFICRICRISLFPSLLKYPARPHCAQISGILYNHQIYRQMNLPGAESCKNNPQTQNGRWIHIVSIRDEDPDPLIFGLPDPDPTCNNGYIKLFSS